MNTQHSPKNTIRQDPRQPEFVQNPYSLYQQMHDMAGPVFWEDYGFWCLADFASVNAVLRDRRFARLPPPDQPLAPLPEHMAEFSAAEKHSLLALEPPDHTRLRKRVNRAFVNRQVELMTADIEASANRRIDAFEQDGNVELLSSYATPIPLSVITQLLGVPDSAGDRLIDWSHAMVKVYTLTQTPEEERQANQAAGEFRAFLRTVITDKRSQPGEDLLSHLIAPDPKGETLSDDEIISVAILLLNAGHEATVHQLGNAVHTLTRQYPLGKPRQALLQLLADPASADAVVNECMRFDAPLHLFMRFAQETIELSADVTLQAGDQVGLLLGAANRCPQRFSQADTFMPLRQDAGNLSLGAGIHFCIGAPLARLELRIALQVLFSRLPTLITTGTHEYLDAYHFHGLRQLELSWQA
ncbi:cytochrome P450 [Granulosicoccus antarcticus]|uniref:Cytochrome P450 monooxygenase PikC n=1 Tax=Granulosicoccus antarcticus IMCC3135 TaxID=1192854 RepID=A0A2Z2NYM5_9GAMM|nr:cytochrome P450 [Granulosicoccus antarcticus]ASJ75031.1 Cytochrome P450 monooxygenase PikC [Granulosicoccus antarcticus IMCC3135]